MQIYREETKTTPLLMLYKGVLTLSGKAIPIDSNTFFTPLYGQIKKYIDNPLDFTRVNVDLQYANGNSRKCLVRVFYLLDKLKAQGYSVLINWYYENDDDDMLELGLIYYSMNNLHFNFIRKKGIVS